MSISSFSASLTRSRTSSVSSSYLTVAVIPVRSNVPPNGISRALLLSVNAVTFFSVTLILIVTESAFASSTEVIVRTYSPAAVLSISVIGSPDSPAVLIVMLSLLASIASPRVIVTGVVLEA